MQAMPAGDRTAELGGLGVVSMRDYCPGMNWLGRGDGSTTIATNMHLWRVWMAARAWRAARITGDKAQEETLSAFLREVALGHVVIAILMVRRIPCLGRHALSTRGSPSHEAIVVP